MQPKNIQSPKNKPPTNGQTLKGGPKGNAGAGNAKPHTHFEVSSAGVKQGKTTPASPKGQQAGI